MTLLAYESQKVQCNHTIQHTVATSLGGVLPEGATEIQVTEAARRGNLRALADSSSVLLKYKVAVFDPVLSAEVLTQQLIAKVKSGYMDQTFRAFAVMFNATRLENCTLHGPNLPRLCHDVQRHPFGELHLCGAQSDRAEPGPERGGRAHEWCDRGCSGGRLSVHFDSYCGSVVVCWMFEK